MTTILGISAFYHDSAAALVRDGQIVAAAQEERFTRVKHDHRFPRHAIDYCLAEAGIGPDQLDHVAFYDKPLLKFDRLLETYLAYAPKGLRSFAQAMPLWLKHKLHLPRLMDQGLDHRYRGRYVFCDHHEAHAASAFFPSPFERAAILTLDGVGEWATTTMGVGRGNRIKLTHEVRFPHSLGLLYSAMTYFCGFRVNSGEYKLMGLAPYGRPRYAELIRRELIDLKADGSFRLNMDYFTYCHGLTMTGKAMAELFGGPARSPETPLTEREADIAASIQAVTEEVVLRCARHVARTTGMKHLVLAGGVALNCVANGKILEEEIFEDLWVQPAAGDAGGALGAALFVWHQLLDKPREVDGVHDRQQGSLLGPRFDTQRIQKMLREAGAVFHHYADEGALLDAAADLLAGEKVVGFFQGRMEFGPRALGGRSIIGDSRSPKMQSVMNLKIKFRESFRPFAPSVLREDASAWFEMSPRHESPYMLLVAAVRAEHRLAASPNGNGEFDIDKRLKALRSSIPAVTHLDYSARLQTVDEGRHGRYYRLIERFKRRTGCPVIINTSFNVRGEPIVCDPREAYHCFMATDIDALVLEDCLLLKAEQPRSAKPAVEQYLSQFSLD